MARVSVIGHGATGTRAARQLIRGSDAHEILIAGLDRDRAERTARSLGPDVGWTDIQHPDRESDVAVLALPCGQHVAAARESLELGRHVVSVSDSVDDVDGLLALDDDARRAGLTVLAGAGMMPGLSDVLVGHGSSWFDEVHEIHVMKFGTGGPECARQHHRALKGVCRDWQGEWTRRPGGSGRELAWFPAPVQAADCYRARLADPHLLIRANPGVSRVTARMAATRRDRLTMHLPMLRRPHPEGLLGAVRVELRGSVDGARREVVLGCSERPAVAAGAVAATAVQHLLDGDRPGARGLAEQLDHMAFLHDLRARGLRAEIFVGSEQTY